MSEETQIDDALSEYGYGRSGKGKTVAIVLLILLLLASLAATVVLGKWWSDEQAKTLEAEQEIASLSASLSEAQNENSELSSLVAEKQSELERLREEWTQQVDTLEEQHQEQLQRSYGQMNEILYDSKKTLAYIGDVETRLRKGQNLAAGEAAKLKGLINGIALLQEKYKKPIHEFRELDRYFSEQLSSLPENAVDPRETAPLGKRIFKKRQLNEERDRYLQQKTRRETIVQARKAANAAYARAQAQMDRISLDNHRYLAKLDEIVASNENRADDIAEFFEKSKEILKIHDKIMSIKPPPEPEVKP